MRTARSPQTDDPLTREIIGAAIEVHRVLGCGLYESAYETCLAHELELRGMDLQRQVKQPLTYKGVELNVGYRIDLIVNREAIVEVKAMEHLHPVCSAQLLTYMKLSGIPVGLVFNFHVELMRDGIRRLVL